MSTINSSSDATEIPDSPDRVFGAVIERNGNVCKQCYRRLRRRDAFPQRVGYSHRELYAFVDEVLPEGSEFGIVDLEYYEQVELDARLEDARPPDEIGETSSCANCGSVDYYRTPDTRTRDGAIAAAAGISVTLDELGVEHDWVALLETVGELKQNPDYAGDDFRTFSEAVATAIRLVEY